MNAVLVIEAISSFLEKELVNIRPDADNGLEREITVYRYNLPDPAPTPMTANEEVTPDSYEGMMPAVVVSPLSYEDKALEDGSALLTVSILACAFSRDPKNVEGPWVVLNILERIRGLLQINRMVGGMFEVQDPLSWQLYDETTKPIWLGEMTTQWRIISPFRVDPEDWKGDFTIEKESD